MSQYEQSDRRAIISKSRNSVKRRQRHSFTYTIPASLTVGSHPITAAFPGDSTYKETTGTGTLTIH